MRRERRSKLKGKKLEVKIHKVDGVWQHERMSRLKAKKLEVRIANEKGFRIRSPSSVLTKWHWRGTLRY